MHKHANAYILYNVFIIFIYYTLYHHFYSIHSGILLSTESFQTFALICLISTSFLNKYKSSWFNFCKAGIICSKVLFIKYNKKQISCLM